MAEVSQADRKRSRKAAAVAVAAVAVFSIAFIGMVLLLDNAAEETKHDQISIAPAPEPDPFYVLLIGSDSRKGTALYTGKKTDHAQVDQHSDVMTLVRVNPETYTLTLVTVPRDTVLDGTNQKINDALLTNDPNKVVSVVERLTGVGIDYYMMTTFTSFEVLINAMGGVTVDVPKNVTVPDPMTAEDVSLKAGKAQQLDGAEALVLARARKEYGDNQDALRQTNVRNIEIAMIQKVLDLDDEDYTNEVLVDLEENTQTNLDMAEAGYLAFEFLQHKDEVTIYSCTGPHEGGLNESGAWVIREDRGAWDELMAVVDAGGDPSGIVDLPRHS